MPHRRLILATTFISILLATTVPPATVAADADEPTYYLPAATGTALTVSQGNGETAWRSDDEDFAFDFVAADGPFRFPILAARGGTVIGARSGIRGGRCREPGDARRPSCWRSVNHVLIDHGDGTSGLYLHLKPGQLPVRSGDIVSAGQPIGFAGNTGWTDEIGLQFQVQRTPAWNERGRGGWFLTASLPVAFADPDVLSQRPDGVPQAGDTVTSGNPAAAREPFRLQRRPVTLPATVPFQIDAERQLAAAYDADSPDGYGLHFAPLVELVGTLEPAAADPGTIVRPLFGGELAFAGCATGSSASLGRSVMISLDLADAEYTAVLGHLSEIEPTLLDLDPAAPPLIIGPNEFLGRYGVILPPDRSPALECPVADPAADELFAAILRDATVTPQGEIIGGTPVSPEPLVGALGYEGFAWWSGPLTATAITEEPGRPRARWNRRTPGHASHMVFGDPIDLVARVTDVTDIAEVRFRAYYPSWPRVPGSTALESFDPTTTWRQLAVCSSVGRGERSSSDCRWNGSREDAIVTYSWDPSTAPPQPTAAWLPRARVAMTRASTECLPVSLAAEVVDTAGHVFSEIGDLPLPTACDERAVDRSQTGRVLYLDPLVPPQAPSPRGEVEDRAWPPLDEPDPLDGDIVWRDRSDNEDGFSIYARRSWFEEDCSITNGPWELVTTVPEDTRRYRPQHARVSRSIEVPDIEGVPGSMDRWEYAVSAFNEAGETRRIPVGGFVRGGEALCDPGLEPPPDEEPLP
ncbi:MAG TPA: M23 family metallopeptidase [Candidatus Limnocylindrales bacterium]|nr:M23 family metallopeptidase [Candidatus Limnocylindrales bacterium]